MRHRIVVLLLAWWIIYPNWDWAKMPTGPFESEAHCRVILALLGLRPEFARCVSDDPQEEPR